MTDRGELFTPEELAVRLDEWANCLDKAQMDLRSDLRCAAIHLRCLASSEGGGVKVKALNFTPASDSSYYFVANSIFGAFWISEYPGSAKPFKLDTHLAITFHDTLDAAKAAAQADYEARIRSALVEVPTVKGEPEPVAWPSDGSCVRCGAVPRTASGLCNTCLDEDAERYENAPPADAGMREALERLKQGIRDIAQACVDGRVCDDVAWFTEIPAETLFDKCCNLLGEDLPTGQPALTAPGATTKSDGGAKAGSSPILASKEDQRPDTHGMMPVGDNAANVGSTGVGPSDPSSTRSEVSALTKRLEQVLKVMRGARNRSEPMAVWADDIKAVEDARAMLDQFEIRRK